MKPVVLFGVGSPIIVEYTETCRRLGYPIAAAVKNRTGPAYYDGEGAVVDVRDFTSALRALPCFCPMFTPLNRFIANKEAAALGCTFSDALIDPTAIVASSVTVGAGSFVNAGSIFGAHASLAEHVVVNRGAAIGHHVDIAAFASIGPGVVVGGQATIGRGAMIGAGAVVLPQVRIGAHAVVGAGSVVVSDVPARSKVFGNPAHVVATELPGLDELLRTAGR